jgi:hypothetical protein
MPSTRDSSSPRAGRSNASRSRSRRPARGGQAALGSERDGGRPQALAAWSQRPLPARLPRRHRGQRRGRGSRPAAVGTMSGTSAGETVRVVYAAHPSDLGRAECLGR